MSLDRARRIGVHAVVLLLALLVVRDVARLDDGLSPIADPFSESNVIRAAEYHAVAGLTSDYGLSNTCYGGQFKREGHRGKGKDARCIYTHYPPGPDLIASVARLCFGKGEIDLFRAFPVGIGILSLLYFARSLLAVLGSGRALFVMAACAAVPMAHNMTHGLHSQGYAFSLLLVQVGLALRLLSRSDAELAARPLAGRELGLVGLLGFVQGWLSFDFFFLVSLSAVPCLLLFHGWGSRGARRHALALAAAAIVGFGLAHVLHFAQVALYFGGVGEAWRDLATAAAQRFDNSVREVKAVGPEDMEPLRLAWRYLTLFPAHEIFFGFPLAPLLGAAALVLLPRALHLPWPGGRRLAWSAGPARLAALLAAVAVSLGWVLVMRQHAAMHPHYVPRHLFLAYLFVLLLLARCPRTVPGSVV